jgi:O-antigen ligase
VYLGAAAAVLRPAHGLAWGYAGLVPGLDFRLYGLAGGATSLGAQAAAYLAMEWFSPSRSRLRPVHLLVTGLVLLLTQAKTSWLFLLLCLLYSAHRRASAHLSASATRSPAVARLEVVALGAAALAAGVGAALYLVRLDLGAVQGGGSLQTFTGRTFVWAASLEVWLEAPIFGYGPSLWATEAFRARHGGFGHAHNQFIQALAAAGVVGLAGLLHYLRTALRVSLAAARAGTPAPLVLLALVAMLLLMDVPLQGLYLLDAFVLLHLLLFALLVSVERAEGEGGGAAGGGAPRPGPPALAQPPR